MDQVYKLVQVQLTPQAGIPCRRQLPRMHIQKNANFGCTSRIAEIVLQSGDDKLHLLPACQMSGTGKGQGGKSCHQGTTSGNLIMRTPNELTQQDGNALENGRRIN